MESGSVCPCCAHSTLFRGRRQVLRQHGRPLRQLRPLELARPPLELGEDGAEARHSRRVAAGSARSRPGLRSQRGRLGELQRVDSKQRCRQAGPIRRSPYDGTDLANYDLYFPPHAPGGEPWAEQGNESEAWKREWFLRAQDLIDQHQPDLYYEDGPIPFGRWGRSLVAHYYNQGLRWHKGSLDVVYTAKQRSECVTGACTLDVERGVVDDIELHPFQTDTCIGDWHYKRGATYKRPKTVLDLLVDVVSRNGNLLLNIPLPASGMPDDEELRILDDITAWMKVNSEGIYATRPWKVFGEGPGIKKTESGDGMNGTPEHFNETKRTDLTGADIRFTTKGGVLYAFAMGHNATETRIVSLAPSHGLEHRKVSHVELLGLPERLRWKQTDDGLIIASPSTWPSEHAVTFKIQFA